MNQRLFAIELRTEIDRAVRGRPVAEGRALALARRHRPFFLSSHVTHNLGATRLAWLRSRDPDLLGQYDARSTGDEISGEK